MTEIAPVDTGRLDEPTPAEIGGLWGWFVALGLLLVFAGLLAVLFPVATTLAANVAVGAVLLGVGIAEVVQSFTMRRWDGFAWLFLTGIVYVAAGTAMVFFPLAGVLTLTVLLAGVLVATGIVELAWALRIRGRDGWGWMLANGIAALAAGLVIAFGLPVTALWVIGLIVGLNFMLSGARFLALGLAARRRLQQAGPAPSTAR